jgi:hypothetical protein
MVKALRLHGIFKLVLVARECDKHLAQQILGRRRFQITIREYQRGNKKKRTIQRNWQHKTNKNTTQYVLDTTIRKQTEIT